MNRTITWLHLSDLHARLRTDWDSRQLTDSLVYDLKAMQGEHGLRPDLVFFTGDIAYGAVDGETMEEQYKKVRVFLDAVRRAFEPEVSVRDIYLVPGNHDVDRGEITPDQTEWLRHPNRKLGDIIGAMRDGKKQWRTWMDRLKSYRSFVTSYGLTHLRPDDPHLVWADARELAGCRVGVVGLNSAWSCADDQDKSKIWCGADLQIPMLIERMGPVNFSFALIHHPGNWFTDREDPAVMRRLRQAFEVVLHGHEHQEWVEVDADRHLVLSAGACYQSSWMDNGYSFGQLDLTRHRGSVWLRQWDKVGGGWVARNVARKTRDGVWSINQLPWLRKADAEKTATSSASVSADGQEPEPGESVAQHYTRRFCQNVIDQYDVLELFGCDIPRELQRHQLTVAYVSLNLSPEDEDEEPGSNPSSPVLGQSKGEGAEEQERLAGRSDSVERILDGLSSAAGRLLIRGPAGAGKSTLLRWCAIHAAQHVLKNHLFLDGKVFADEGSGDATERRRGFEGESSRDLRSWRQKVPVLIRLRDCPSGKLPAANDLPRFLAKHLPSAPNDWMTGMLDAGRVLVLLDGVDEVHRDKRTRLAEEIGELIRTYPRCTYVITTRPGAIERGWLSRLQFTEARVEPMSRGDRDEFIENWYRSAALELKHRPRPGEDLSQTAVRLKTELADQPELGALATNPLLCAMICALYRERQERLPETPPELCEALCHMLLHRRERETPGLEEAHFVATWRALQYPQKKALLADLAWYMVGKGESSIDRQSATSLVAAGLTSTPGRSEGEAAEVLQALVERSGLLRPAGDDRIDFLHNTLKEYMAAGVVVEAGNWKSVAERADDPAWQPVILFALALAPEPFSSALVRRLMDRVPALGLGKHGKSSGRSGGLTRKERAALTEVKSRQFFLVRCRAAAKRLAADLSAAIDELAQRILPPASIGEVEALAQIGPRVLFYGGANLLNGGWWERQNCPMSVRCLRLLRRIGGPRAKAALRCIRRLPSYSSQLTGEWILAWDELCPDDDLFWPFDEKVSVTASNTHVSNLAPLSGLSSVRRLDLWYTRVRDLAPLAALTSLSSINLQSTPVADLGPLAGLAALQSLDLHNTQVADLSPLAGLNALSSLNLGRTPVVDLRPLARLAALRSLDLRGSQVVELGPLRDLRSLQRLCLTKTKVTDLSALTGLIALQYLDLGATPVVDIGPLGRLNALEMVELIGTRVTDLAPLANLTALRILNLRATPVAELGPLANLISLERLDLGRTKVKDVGPLASLTALQSLDLYRTQVRDVGPLARLTALQELDLAGTQVRSLSPLAGLTSLQELDLAGTPVVDLRPLGKLTALRELNVGRTKVTDLGSLAGLTELESVDLRMAPVNDLGALVGIGSLRYIYVGGWNGGDDWVARFRRLRPDVYVGVIEPDDEDDVV